MLNLSWHNFCKTLQKGYMVPGGLKGVMEKCQSDGSFFPLFLFFLSLPDKSHCLTSFMKEASQETPVETLGCDRIWSTGNNTTTGCARLLLSLCLWLVLSKNNKITISKTEAPPQTILIYSGGFFS